MIKKISWQRIILGVDDDGEDYDGKDDDGRDDDGEDGAHLLRSLQGQHQGKCKHCCLGQAQTWSTNSNILADKKFSNFIKPAREAHGPEGSVRWER